MKSKTEYVTFHTQEKRQYVLITEQVAEVVEASGIKEGMVLVSASHM